MTWFPEDTAELHDELRDHPAWTTAALEPIAGEAHAQIAGAEAREDQVRPPIPAPPGHVGQRLPSRRA